MNIRRHRRSLIAGAALVALALIALPAAARTWHGFWNNDNETGALVASVDPDGPAAGAGLQRGDLIVGVDGAEITGRIEFLEAISDNGADDALRFEVRRGNDLVSLTATVGQSNGNPYLGILMGPDGLGANAADTFGELRNRRDRGDQQFRGRRGGHFFDRRGMGPRTLRDQDPQQQPQLRQSATPRA